jgi:hypothetical protein
MPIIRKVTNTAVAGTFFPLQGSQYEYLPFNALIEFAIINKDATGTNDLKATVYSGSDVLQEQSNVDVKATLTAVYPDDFLLQDVAAAGERIGVQLDATASAAATALTVVRITPL